MTCAAWQDAVEQTPQQQPLDSALQAGIVAELTFAHAMQSTGMLCTDHVEVALVGREAEALEADDVRCERRCSRSS
jgi:hypothetical protein